MGAKERREFTGSDDGGLGVGDQEVATPSAEQENRGDNALGIR